MDDTRVCAAYQVDAKCKNGEDDAAYCTSTYRRLSRDYQRVIEHQRTPLLGGCLEAKG